jgi:hypothetical protein
MPSTASICKGALHTSALAVRRPLKAVAVALPLLAAPLQAQVLIGYLLGEKLASPSFNMGFEVGVNFASLDGPAGAARINKTVFGLFADWRFSEHLHLTGAILPFAARGATGISPIPTGDPTIDSQIQGGTMERTIGLIDFPLLVKWAPKRQTGFRVGVGPSFGLITSANDRYAATTAGGTPYVVERDIEDQLPSWDLGVSVDLEWRFPMLSIGARYTHGLTDIAQAASTETVHSRTLTGTGRIYLGKRGNKRPPT